MSMRIIVGAFKRDSAPVGGFVNQMLNVETCFRRSMFIPPAELRDMKLWSCSVLERLSIVFSFNVSPVCADWRFILHDAFNS